MSKKCTAIYNNILSNFSLLSENEMLNIRGGADVVKPKSRPREILDWDDHAQATSTVQSTEEPSLID